jgi:hypothetical protein
VKRSSTESGGKADVLASWTIQNAEEGNNKLEREEMERCSNTYGCPLDEFIKALATYSGLKASDLSGPVRSPRLVIEYPVFLSARATRSAKICPAAFLVSGSINKLNASGL